jgi:hypothetical protein
MNDYALCALQSCPDGGTYTPPQPYGCGILEQRRFGFLGKLKQTRLEKALFG